MREEESIGNPGIPANADRDSHCLCFHRETGKLKEKKEKKENIRQTFHKPQADGNARIYIKNYCLKMKKCPLYIKTQRRRRGDQLLLRRNGDTVCKGKSVNGSIFGAKMGCRCWNLYGIAFRQDWEGERGAADRIYHCFDIKKYRRCAEMGKGQNIGTLKKREQGSMLLSSNYRRNSTYVANIG